MTLSDETRRRIRDAAGNRCGYCLSPQHLHPLSRGGSDDEENLWLSCRMCNNFKSNRTEAIDPVLGEAVPIFNPRTQKWLEHFEWSDDATQIVGRSAVGRASVVVLQLNNFIAVTVRRHWISAGWHPPADL